MEPRSGHHHAVSDVAAAYFQLRELDLELEIARRTLASRQDSLRITQMLANGGATSMLDVRQAEQLVFTAAGTIPDLERRIEQQENFISILLGNNPVPSPVERNSQSKRTRRKFRRGFLRPFGTPAGHPTGRSAVDRG